MVEEERELFGGGVGYWWTVFVVRVRDVRMCESSGCALTFVLSQTTKNRAIHHGNCATGYTAASHATPTRSHDQRRSGEVAKGTTARKFTAYIGCKSRVSSWKKYSQVAAHAKSQISE